MRFAYADPPYLGQCGRYGHRHDPPYGCWDEIDTHAGLIRALVAEYPFGWALSLSSPSLRHLLPLTPADCRIAAWGKPYVSYRPNVNPAYSWEPVLFVTRRERSRLEQTGVDWVVAPRTANRAVDGAKPDEFAFWLFRLLGLRADDELDDIFPGSGAVGRAWLEVRNQFAFGTLFAADAIAGDSGE